jgi:hypothetical protein
MDPVIFTGVVPEEECHEERPRIYQDGAISPQLRGKIVSKEISASFMKLVYISGFFFLSLGLIVVLLIIYTALFGYR